MKYLLTITTIFLFPLLILAKTGNTPALQQMQQHRNLCFIENKGQVSDQYGHPRTDIQYKVGGHGGLNVFIGNGQIHYQFSNTGTANQHIRQNDAEKVCDKASTINLYRMDVSLEGANPHPQTITEQQQCYYENYHTANFKGAVSSFGKITYKEVYPNIDWVFYIKNDQLEYDFIVHPGGNVKDIKMRYGGSTGINEKNNQVSAITPFGAISEGKLYAYEQERHKNIPSAFVLEGNTLSFAVASYKGTLVIDPVIGWATYLGGSSLDFGSGIACDSLGNVYIGGYTASANNIATTGSYQDSLAGEADAFIAKFNGSGALLWATYYGGNIGATGAGISCDGSGNVYLTGNTYSSDSISTPGCWQPAIGGQEDAFLAKFSGNGALVWATYFGGPLNDFGSSVACDIAGNVYISGGTNSTSGITTTGSYQSIYGGGFDDAFLAKFSAGGMLLWATYYGGDTSDNGAGLACYDTSVYLTGTTSSTNSIATAGAFKTAGGGSSQDAYLAKFGAGGSLQWATYFGGSGADMGFGIANDHSGNIYITGSTTSYDSIATAGAHQTALIGGGDCFLAAFTAAGLLNWATYIGGTSYGPSSSGNGTYGTDVFCDDSGNIYITGETGSEDSIATPDGYENHNMGGNDAYLIEFSNAGSLLWGSYFGGNGTEGGDGVTCDHFGNVYITGRTDSWDSVATPGAYQTVFGGFVGDAFLAKFSVPTPLGNQTFHAQTATINIYPNPVKDILYLDYENLPNGILTITDITGQEIMVENLPCGYGADAINISYFPCGVYLFQVTSNGFDIRKGKIVKQ